MRIPIEQPQYFMESIQVFCFFVAHFFTHLPVSMVSLLFIAASQAGTFPEFHSAGGRRNRRCRSWGRPWRWVVPFWCYRCHGCVDSLIFLGLKIRKQALLWVSFDADESSRMDDKKQLPKEAPHHTHSTKKKMAGRRWNLDLFFLSCFFAGPLCVRVRKMGV